MDGMSNWAVASLNTNGIPALLLLAYVGSLGIPFPITLCIMAAGAFTRVGILDWRFALPACLLGASLADNSEYILGRLAGRWLKRRFDHKTVWQQALSILNRQRGWAILLTRFWLTPLAPAINVIAGSRFPYARFLLFDLAGQLLWVLLYGGLGYIFADQWQQVSQTVSGFSWLSFGLTALVAAVYFLFARQNAKVLQK
jgi:membrane protein DedA with SNARE-associated domain